MATPNHTFPPPPVPPHALEADFVATTTVTTAVSPLTTITTTTLVETFAQPRNIESKSDTLTPRLTCPG